MFLFYLGLVFWAFSILWVYPLFQEQDIGMGVVFALLAFCFYFLFVFSSEPKKGDESLAFKFSKCIYLSLITIIFQVVGLWLYIEIFSRWRELTFLTPFFKAIFWLLKIPVTVTDGNLYLYGVANYVQTFLPNPSNLGLVYLLMFTAGNFSLFFITKEKKKTLKIFLVSLVSLVIYLFLRVVFLLGLFTNQEVGILGVSWYYLAYFWHPIAGVITFLPWVFLEYLLFRKEFMILFNLKQFYNREILLANLKPALYLGLSIILLLLTIFWVPSGKPKGGRVLLEEYYSDWSKSTKPIDEQWYGSASTYNYYTLRTYLNSYFDVTINQNPLDNLDLYQYDVLIIKVPTKPYPQKVIEKIVSYVRNGGGLWVIGDHTNVFGTTTYLNPLLDNFGLKLRYDGVYHNEHGSFNSIYTESLFKHPIIQNVPVFLFATPCSLQATNLRMRIVEPGLTSKAYPLSYTNRNFFPDTKPDLNAFAGANTLLAAGNFGQGRVAVFTDSTVFSNFFMYLPGKPELALATVAWLNHQPSGTIAKLLLLIGSILLWACFFFFYLNLKSDQRNLFWPMILTLLMVIGAIPVINILNRESFTLSEEVKPIPKVGFLGKYSSIYLPFAEWKQDEKNYNTFYLWGQRVGLRNKYYFRLNEESINESKALFIILPQKKYSENDIEKLDFYLKQGGKIFILDHGGDQSSANDFLKRYGLSIDYHQDGIGQIININTGFVFNNIPPLGVVKGEGEKRLYWAPTNGDHEVYPVYIKKTVEKGELHVFGGVLNFANNFFGYDNVVPEGEKLKINELILNIYKSVY